MVVLGNVINRLVHLFEILHGIMRFMRRFIVGKRRSTHSLPTEERLHHKAAEYNI